MSPARHFLTSRTIQRTQRRHFAMSVLVPTILVLVIPWAWPEYVFQYSALTAGAMWLICWTAVGGLGVSVGFHRLFAHRSFMCGHRTRYALGAFGSMAGQGSVVYWTALHRAHHAFSDAELDPHSPTPRPGETPLSALVRAHCVWPVSHAVPSPVRFARDLLKDKTARQLTQHYHYWFCAGLVLPGCLGLLGGFSFGNFIWGLYWGGLVRLVAGQHLIWSVNSICHRFGTRAHMTDDTSRNNALLAWLTFGEAWHNDHHHAPASPRLSTSSLRIDPGWLMIATLAKLKLASLRSREDVRPLNSG